MTWSKPFVDAVLSNPTLAVLLPPLKRDQQWATNELIQSKGLSEDNEKNWAAIKAINDAHSHLLAMNIAAPTTSSVVVSAMANNQSILTADSIPKDTMPVKQSPTRLPAILASDTCCARFRIIFASFDKTADHIKPPILMDTVEEISATDSTTTCISTLSNAINNLLDMFSSERDFISHNVQWPSNLSTLSKGLLVQGLLQMQLTKSFTDTTEKTGLSILSLIPPIHRQGDTQGDSSLCNPEIFLGETLDNLTKVNISININTFVLLQIGLTVCANTFLLCCTFTQVQSTSEADQDSHPIPFLYTAAMKRENIITSQQLQDTIVGHSKQTLLVLYTVLACLDTIAACIGKEASNPDILRNTCHNNWLSSSSTCCDLVHKALTTTLQLLENTATGGAMLPTTMLYQDLDQKQKQDNDKMLAAAKCLKLVTNSSVHGARHRGGHNPHYTNTDVQNKSPQPNQPRPPHNDWGPRPH